jgi:hypothetical protein
MWYRNFSEGRTFHTSVFTNPLTVMPDLSSPERQSKKEDYDLYADMDETLILYGYATLFVVACPWVPALALVMNVLECFLDQKKLILLYRRPFPQPAANLEPWDTAFDIFGIIAMLTNTAVIIFAAHSFDASATYVPPPECHFASFPNCLGPHAQKLVLFLGIEHLLIFARLAVAFAMPSMPREVRLLMMQQRVVLHKHLNLGGDEEDQEARASAMLTGNTPAPYIWDQDDEEYES